MGVVLLDRFVAIGTHIMQRNQIRQDPFFPGDGPVLLITPGLCPMAIYASVLDCNCAGLEGMVTLNTGNFKFHGMPGMCEGHRMAFVQPFEGHREFVFIDLWNLGFSAANSMTQ
jgi:hypothetical protein